MQLSSKKEGELAGTLLLPLFLSRLRRAGDGGGEIVSLLVWEPAVTCDYRLKQQVTALSLKWKGSWQTLWLDATYGNIHGARTPIFPVTFLYFTISETTAKQCHCYSVPWERSWQSLKWKVFRYWALEILLICFVVSEGDQVRVEDKHESSGKLALLFLCYTDLGVK